MWVNTRKSKVTGKKQYRAMKNRNITWVDDPEDTDIIDRGSQKDARITMYRIMNSFDEYGYGHEELKNESE